MVSRLDRHIKKGQSLARAAELIHIEDNGTSIADQIREQKVDWPEVVEKFREQKVVTSGEITALTWVRRCRLIMDEFLQLMEEKRAPKTGTTCWKPWSSVSPATARQEAMAAAAASPTSRLC